jgi:hypothetical protein
MLNIVEMPNLNILFAYTVICAFRLVIILMGGVNAHHRQANGVYDSVVEGVRREFECFKERVFRIYDLFVLYLK